MNRRRLLLLAAAAVAGCASNQPMTAQNVAAAAQIRDSSFDAAATILGPEQLTLTQRGLLADRVRWRVRVIVDKATRTSTAQLYVSVWHQDRSARRYRSASLLGGQQLRATPIDYEPNCSAGGGYVSCTHTETFGVEIPAAAWAAASTAGLAVRLNAQSGDENVLQIPADYVRGMQAKVSAHFGTTGG